MEYISVEKNKEGPSETLWHLEQMIEQIGNGKKFAPVHEATLRDHFPQFYKKWEGKWQKKA